MLLGTPPLFTVWPPPGEAFLDQDIANIATVDPDCSEGSSPCAVDAESLDGEGITVEQG